jgi:hypothetical protein
MIDKKMEENDEQVEEEETLPFLVVSFFFNVCTHDYADPQRERERDAVCANCQDTQKLFYSLKKEKREESQVLLGHNNFTKPVVEANFLPTK